MRKIVHLLVVCLMTISVLHTLTSLFTFDAQASPPPPDDGVDGIQYIEGDWVVTGSENYSDEKIILSGNLIIQSGGSLTLSNVTLAINCTIQDGEFGIEVLNGGSLSVTDGDNDPATTYDFSVITDSPFDSENGSSDYEYSIKAFQGSSISLRNTIIRESGFDMMGSNYGLFIEADDTIIENCTFWDNYYALFLRNTENFKIGYNKINNSEHGITLDSSSNYGIVHNNEVHHNNYGMDMYGSNITVKDNTFHNNSYGIYTKFNRDCQIYNNELLFNTYGLDLYGDINIIENNTLYNNSYGLRAGGSNNIISNNTAHNNSLVGFDLGDLMDSTIFNNTIFYNGNGGWTHNLAIGSCDNLDIHNNTIQRLHPDSYHSVMISYSSNLNFHNNTVSFNAQPWSTIRCDMLTATSTNIKFYNNNISNNNGIGLHIWGQHSPENYVEIKNNVFYDNNAYAMELYKMQAYTVTHNTISSAFGEGLFIDDVANGEFSNNTILVGGFNFVLRDSYGSPDDTYFVVTNTTCDPSQTWIMSNNPTLVIEYFLHVNVTDIYGPAPSVNVTVTSVSANTTFQGKTDEGGFIRFIKLINQTIDGSGNTYYDPYNITASSGGYTVYGVIEPTMNISQTVNVYFNANLPPEAPSDLVAFSNVTNVDLNWIPSHSPDLHHYVVYRNGSGSNWVEVYNSSGLLLPQRTWNFWTDPQAATDWTTYRYRVKAGDDGGQYSGYSNIAKCGDWVIDGTKLFSDIDVQLNGSLIILPSGNLTFKNVNLRFNCSSRAEFGVDVRPGGQLYILDNDNVPQTINDRSNITSLNPGDKDRNFYFKMAGSKFEMRNSRLANCGSDLQFEVVTWTVKKAEDVVIYSDPWTRGLYISSSDSIIENSLFENNFVSIILDGSDNSIIYGNTFSDNTFGVYLNTASNSTLEGNTFANHMAYPVYVLNSVGNLIVSNEVTNRPDYQATPAQEAGIVLKGWGSERNDLVRNNVTYGDHGIYLYQAGVDNIVSGNIIRDSKFGIYVYDTSWLILLGNNIVNISESGCYLNYGHFVTIEDGSMNMTAIGYYSFGSDNVIISNVSVMNAEYGTIFLFSDNLEIINFSVDTADWGIGMSGSSFVTFTDILLDNCSGGVLAWNSPFIEFFNLNVYNITGDAILLTGVEDIKFTNSTLNAAVDIFNLSISSVILFNTTYNQTRVKMDNSSSIALHWLLDVEVLDWLGNPVPGAQVKIRKPLGTLVYSGITGPGGQVRWIWLHERTQFAFSNETSTPYMIHAVFGNHSGSITLFLNQSTNVSVYLENDPPSASNVIISPLSPTTIDDLTLSYQYSDPENDVEGSTMIIWYINGVQNSSLNNQMVIDNLTTSKGETWYCEVIPQDGTVYGPPMTSTPVTIQNTPPVVEDVTIVQTAPTSSDYLNIAFNFSDIDGDSEGQSQYRWHFWNGTDWLYSGVDSLELNPSFTAKGELWKCIVTPHDGDDLGNPMDSNVVTIGNSAPEVSDVIISPVAPMSNETLNVSYTYFDLDSDPESGSMIQWYKNSTEQLALNNSTSVDSSLTQKGEKWYYIITPYDGEDFGVSIMSDAVIIGNTPPTVSNITLSPIAPKTGDDLNVSYEYSDNDGDSESLDTIVRWLRWNGFEFFDTGLRGKTLPSGHTFKGEIWTCEVIPHDGWNEGTPTLSDMNVTIVNSAPFVINAKILPPNPISISDLLASYQYVDLDFDSQSGSLIRWYQNDVEQIDLNDSLTVSASRTLKGEVWYYIVTPSDGEDLGVPVQSEKATMGNTPPSVSNVTISPLNPDTKDVLTVSYDFFDIDGDSESLDTVVKWLRWSGADFFDTGHRGRNLSAEITFKGEIWTCEVIPHDGEDEGLANRSEMNVTIINSAPTILGAEITPPNPTSVMDLTASYDYWDVDFDLESGSLIRWYQNDVEQVDLNDSVSVSASRTLKGDIWYYIVTPSDGEDLGIPFKSDNVTTGNTPPSTSNITISPLNPKTGDVLTVSYDFYDIDSDPESLDTTVKWLRWDGADFFDTGYRGKNLSSDHTQKGELWTCEVIPHDGEDEGTANRSGMNVTIVNSAPTVLTAAISPTSPTAESDLNASYTYYDVDGDTDSGSLISWFKDDVEQLDLAGNFTVNSTRTQKGEVWYYIITPSDGVDFGTPMQSDNVTIGNTPPTVSNITISPLNPATVDDLTASYDFNDTDGDSESLDTVVRWLRWDINKFIDTGLRGKTLSSSYTARGDIWTCEVVPHDGLNEGTATQSDMNVTIGNTEPSILSASITPSDPPSGSNLTASYNYYDVDSDPESGSIIRWYKNDVEQWGLNDTFIVISSFTQPGEIWHYIITPSDGMEYGVPVISENVTIGNTPPYASNITISPSNPDTEDDLTVTYDYYDVEGNPESLDTVVRWLRWDIDKFIDTGHRGKTLSSDYTSQGEIWTCEVLPHDGLDEGAPTRSDMNVTIQNTVPTVLSAEISPSDPTADTDISASYNYYDVDGDFESGSTIRWFQNSVEQLDLYGNFSVNYTRALRGDIWYYIITPSDGLGFGAPFKSENKTIGNTPPYVTSITISPVNPITEDDLSASYDYFDSDGDFESLDTVIKWLRWSGSDFFDTGHRGRNLSSAHTAKGDIWTCEVVPHDGGDEGSSIRSDMNVTIGNSAPSILDAQITPVNPTAADDLSAGYTYYDVDSDPESGSMIAWFRNGIEQTDLNGSISVSSTRTQKGDTWYYIIIPSDGEDSGVPVQSDTATIGNTPPQASNIAISPLIPSTGDDLVASYDYYDSDGDAESLDTTVKWLLWSGITFIDTGYRGKTLSSAHTSKGETWTCEVIPHDGEDEGLATQSSMNVTIANTAPAASDAVISPTDPTSEEDLTADYEYTDVDLDTESGSIIQWFRNGIGRVDLYGSISVNFSRTQKGEGWYYTITPYDGEDFGTPVQSDSVIIGNTPPSVLNITIAPLNPTTQDDLTVTYDFYDGDGDSESLDTTVRWLRWSGTDFVDTGFRGQTLSSSHTSKGELWTCEISPHDGVDSGATVTSGTVVTILNSKPTASNLYITPQEPTGGNDLAANYDYYDLDSDPESGSEIMWFRNGVHVPALDNESLVPHSMTAKGQTWNFSVHPNDNFEFGDWVGSEAVTIQNSPPSATNLSITPNPPLGDDDLVALYTFTDDDGDAEADYEIRWYKNVFAQELYNHQLQVDSSATGKDELWSFTLRVYDGKDWSETFTSHYVVIENSRPIINSISPSEVTQEISEIESLEFFVDAEDPDDDILIYRWKLGKTTVGSDDYYLFETDYESEGVYTLNLTVQDFGERSYSQFYEWVITVNNVNRLPELEVTEPLTKTPKMEEDTSLRFLIDETDPDSGDTLDIKWYFDDVVAQEGGSSYTYHADFAAAGDHEVKVVVDDGTDSSEYGWNLTVADIAEEALLGYSYDWWGLVLAIMSGVVALLLAFIGLMRVKKKKGALKKYMAEIDELTKDTALSPGEYEEKLSDIEARINDEFKQGQIEDLHYLMLQDIVASKRGEARKAEVASMFGRLPAGVVKDLDNMLKDGKITPEEYEGFVATISMTESLTPEEKDELSKVIEKWGEQDDDMTSQDSQSVKDKIIKDELDEILDDTDTSED